jgi:hypothetical protein
MELTNTRKRFQKRVEFEREIISLANSIPHLLEPLYGLSRPAIEHWQKVNENSLKDNIALTIIALSRDLMAFCDSSKNTFDLDKRINSGELHKRINEFQLLLRGPN